MVIIIHMRKLFIIATAARFSSSVGSIQESVLHYFYVRLFIVRSTSAPFFTFDFVLYWCFLGCLPKTIARFFVIICPLSQAFVDVWSMYVFLIVSLLWAIWKNWLESVFKMRIFLWKDSAFDRQIWPLSIKSVPCWSVIN